MSNSEREKKLIFLLPVLLIVAVAVWIPNFLPQKGGSGKKNILDLSDQLPALPEVLSKAPVRIESYQQDPSAYPDWGRNPFIPEGWTPQKAVEPTNEVIEAKEIILNGIFWNKQRPSALINDQVVGIGTKLNGYEVMGITEDTVTVNDGEKDIKLKMHE